MPKRSETKYQDKYYRKRVKRPDGTWQDVYGKTLAERDMKVEELRKQWTDGAAAEEIRRNTVFFYEYVGAWYLRKSPHMSAQWKKTAQRYINNVICPVIGRKPMAEITSDDLADILATVADKSRSYQKDIVQLLKQVFDAAEDADVIRKNPSRKLKAGGKKPVKRDALTETQQETLLQAVEGTAIKSFIYLALYTGMRREEILGLYWDCVELSGDAPHINVRRVCIWENNHRPEIREVLKSDAGWRTIPIPQQLVLILQEEWAKLSEDEQKKKLPVIYGPDGGPLSYSAFRGRWKVITARSTESGRALGEKIPRHNISVTIDFRVRPHILRKTYVTRLIMNKVPVKRVQYLAGHADPELTLQIYTDLMEHAPEDLIGDIQGAFSAGGNTPGNTPSGTE